MYMSPKIEGTDLLRRKTIEMISMYAKFDTDSTDILGL